MVYHACMIYCNGKKLLVILLPGCGFTSARGWIAYIYHRSSLRRFCLSSCWLVGGYWLGWIIVLQADWSQMTVQMQCIWTVGHHQSEPLLLCFCLQGGSFPFYFWRLPLEPNFPRILPRRSPSKGLEFLFETIFLPKFPHTFHMRLQC